MTKAWAQFRELGVPRCHECGRLILPWQGWICVVEEWPVHHTCHHRDTEHMLAYINAEAAADPDGYRFDYYDRCRFCGRETPAP